MAVLKDRSNFLSRKGHSGNEWACTRTCATPNTGVLYSGVAHLTYKAKVESDIFTFPGIFPLMLWFERIGFFSWAYSGILLYKDILFSMGIVHWTGGSIHDNASETCEHATWLAWQLRLLWLAGVCSWFFWKTVKLWDFLGLDGNVIKMDRMIMGVNPSVHQAESEPLCCCSSR